jgi:hypothetical protein
VIVASDTKHLVALLEQSARDSDRPDRPADHRDENFIWK